MSLYFKIQPLSPKSIIASPSIWEETLARDSTCKRNSEMEETTETWMKVTNVTSTAVYIRFRCPLLWQHVSSPQKIWQHIDGPRFIWRTQNSTCSTRSTNSTQREETRNATNSTSLSCNHPYLTWIVPPTTPYVYKELAFLIANTIYEWLWRKVSNSVVKIFFFNNLNVYFSEFYLKVCLFVLLLMQRVCTSNP